MTPPLSTLDLITVSSTVVVACFAVLQVYLAWRDRRDRLLAAYNVVFADWNRLLISSVHLREENLTVLAEHGTLDPAQVQPSDWPLLAGSLSVLGPATAYYGATAHALACEAARDVRLLTLLAQAAAPGGRPPEQVAALAHVEKALRTKLADIVALLEDALGVAPPWVRTAGIDLGSPTSTIGRGVVSAARRRGRPVYWGIYPIRPFPWPLWR